MAKGSVRKKGKKWYYRFYVEDESGKMVQREFAGTESKSETEALLRKAMEDYEAKKFVAKPENTTVGMLLDMWVEEELKPGNLSNGTVMAYMGTVNRIKKYPIGDRKLKTVTAEHLQAFMDFLTFGGQNPDGTTAKALSKGYLRLFSAVLQGAFRFAVFPKKLISFIESIKERGVITPATVRQKENGRYELVSGHRRKRASELAGYDTLRCEVVDLSREEATILMVESNFQRSQILPSEKAFAYKMRLEALSRQGKRTDLTCAPVGHKSEGMKSRDVIAQESGDSREQVRRYIRLTNLVPELLEFVDEGRIKMRPAVELSYLDEDCQRDIVDEIDMNDATPSHAQTIKMRKFYEEGKLTTEVISSIMAEDKPNQREKIVLRGDRVRQLIDYATNPEKTNAKIKRQFTEKQYQALADVISYAKDEEKTEREFYVEGINCNVSIARDQFVTVKEQYQKMDGIQAYHGYLSFRETDISPELAQKIGMEFAGEVWGKRFQVVVTTHLNTKHLHCHFVINSVSFVDGKRLWGDEKAWFKFRKVADRICEKYGLYYNPNPNRSKQSEYLTMKAKAGMPTRYTVAKEAIDYAIDHSKTLKEFQFALKEMGYAYNLSPSRKYWTVIPKGYDKPIRLKNLGDDYTNDKIIERIKSNRDRWAEIKPFQRQSYKVRQYRLPTREQKLRKKGSLYGLYLYYCYRLGYLPKYRKQNNARLHYLLKEDLMKLDRITEEVRLLGRENISTDEQLFSYKASLEGQMKDLIAGRTHLRKKIRTKIDDGQLQKAKEEIASINGKLKVLRKEVRLCDGIAERSKAMEQNLEQIHTEEQKIQRKEKSRYEQRW